MEYTVQQLDEICSRIDRLAEQIAHPGFGTHEEQVTSEVVQLIQCMGESIAWAYGQQQRPGLGEQFAQPFVDRRLRDRLKALLTERKPMRRELQSRIAAQVLQTIHILLQATPTESTLFCNLTAGWYLNEVVAAQLDFRENEDLLPLWMTVVKDIATMLDRDNMMLFFDPCGEKPFPIFTEAIRYYHHPVSQVRTHVQATSLEIFLKLRDEEFWSEAIFQLVLSESYVFFTHVCCLLRDFWRMADDAVRSGARRDVRSALYIQNDILMYVNDIFMCEIPQFSDILQEKLLRFAVLPVLVRSILRPSATSAVASPAEQQDMLSPQTAWYLLHDMLATLRNSPVFAALAFVLLRPQVPEEVLRLVSSSPPRTPTQYFAIQASWGVNARPGPFDRGDTTSDEVLYAMPPLPLIGLLDTRDRSRLLVHNRLLDALEERIRSLASSGEAVDLAGSMLGAVALLLRTLRAAREGLDGGVAERLGGALCEVLAMHRQLQWAVLEGALTALSELALAADMPLGRARLLLGPRLRERVLFPLASELLQSGSKQPVGLAQDLWLQEFQEQWAAHQVPTTDATVLQRQRDLLEQGSTAEVPGTPEGRARCIRVLLGSWRLAASFASNSDARHLDRMPGLGEAEMEETAKFKPGVPVHIGKMNRVKCYARSGRRGAEQEAVYLLPAQASLLLVRPDEQKPFWAVPVITEPLRYVRMMTQSSEKSGPLEQIVSNSDEPQRILRLEVATPRSPFLKASPSDVSATGAAVRQASPSRLVGTPMGGNPDRMSATLGGPGLLGTPAVAGQDRMAMTVPAVSPLGSAVVGGREAPSLTLVFADERRRRVACKILAQARHTVTQHMAEGVNSFLVEARDDQL